MDGVVLGRILFAFTIGFHFLFPPLTIGMAWIIVWMMRLYNKHGLDFHKNMARFWIKLFVATFAVGVATGITMEFQFGTNWSEYSRFVGDIFGAPLAAEGIFTFFLESTFIGVLLFGWNRFSRRTLYFAAWMVALGSTMSAFWIIAANSWMQTPDGFHIVNGRAELTSFFDAVFNPSTMPRYIHTVNAAISTGAFFVLGVSAWFLLKKRHSLFAKESFRIALMFALISAMMQLAIGHWSGVQVAHTQPEKLAAFEGFYETQRMAPGVIFGIPDNDEERLKYAIEIPGMVSLLSYGDWNAEVKGLKAFPKDERPPVHATYWSFRIMVQIGMYFIFFTIIGVWLLYKRRLWKTRWYLKLALFSIPLPFLANELDWIVAEVGRRPWIVYHIMKTRDAISVTVPAWQVLVTLIAFIFVYALLGYLWIYLLRKEIQHGPDEGPTEDRSEVTA